MGSGGYDFTILQAFFSTLARSCLRAHRGYGFPGLKPENPNEVTMWLRDVGVDGMASAVSRPSRPGPIWQSGLFVKLNDNGTAPAAFETAFYSTEGFTSRANGARGAVAPDGTLLNLSVSNR